MRHAILIIAHHNIEQVDRLCKLFNDPRFKVFLHMDRKALAGSLVDKPFDQDKFLASNPDVTVIPPISVSWGDYSQIACEINLLKAATALDSFDRYHLISGDDLPIKPLDDIDYFFERNPETEYVSIQEEGCYTEISREVRERIDLYWPLQSILGRRGRLLRYCAYIQRRLHISRLKGTGLEHIAKGPNWFSITGEFAKYVVEKSGWIAEHFRCTQCADEIFLQTLAVNSKFADRLPRSVGDDNLAALRLIDWKRGTPYTWAMKDYEEIANSDALFARKFDSRENPELFESVCEMVNCGSAAYK